MKKVNDDSQKIMTEQETKKKLYGIAKMRGVDIEFLHVWDKWDKLINNCTNESEAKHMGVMAMADIYKLVGFKGGLTVNGEVIIPDDGEAPKSIFED